MTTIDFSPLFRSTVGFDRLTKLLESSYDWNEGSGSYPPYNIEKISIDQYRITLALAGFTADELSIEVRENALSVEGRKKAQQKTETFLYRGIAGRSFRRQFQLADHIKVTGAALRNGLLTIDLVREIPESMKPRKIEILSDEAAEVTSPADGVAVEQAHAA